MRIELLKVTRFLFCVMDTVMFFRFFSSMFSRRLKGNYELFWALLITIGTFLENTLQTTWLNLLFLPIWYFIYVSVAFEISVKNSIIYTLVYYAIFAGGEVACEICYRFLSECFQMNIDVWIAGDGVYFMLIDYLYRYLFLVFIMRFTRKLEIQQNQDFAWYLLIVPVTTIFVLSSFMYLEFPENPILQAVMSVGALLLNFSNAAMFIVLERYTAIMNEKKYDALYQVKQKMEDERFQNIAKLNADYRCYMHDMHNYLNNIRLLAMQQENEAVVKIINDMEGEIQNKRVEHHLYCGNSVLNSILTEQSSRAEAQEIAMHIFVERFLGLEFILETDMISIFGNLLDNAITAAAQCKKEKTVDIKLFMGNQYMFVFYMENSYDRVKREEGKFVTTKQEEGHGLGIGIVRRLAEKYGGTLTLEAGAEKFVTILTISAMQQGESANFGAEHA